MCEPVTNLFIPSVCEFFYVSVSFSVRGLTQPYCYGISSGDSMDKGKLWLFYTCGIAGIEVSRSVGDIVFYR